MKVKAILTGLACVAVGMGVWMLFLRAPAGGGSVSSDGAAKSATAGREANSNSVAVLPPPPIAATITAQAAPTTGQLGSGTQQTTAADPATAEPQVKINGYIVLDPIARIALNFVGSDPDADSYWIGAINDSALPAEERKDLIEDLNEDGLIDPHHPTAQDMPLIAARLRLIEQLSPTAMDGVNRAAFAEAYKDLIGLLNGQEPP